MKWYLAKFVYQVVSGNGSHVAQFDEQLRLIRADEFECLPAGRQGREKKRVSLEDWANVLSQMIKKNL
jgi:hypothetical protein